MEREAGMTAAIVELDALADAVRSAAEDDDFLAVCWPRLVLGIIGRLHVGGGGRKFGGTGVDALVDGPHIQLVAVGPHLVFLETDEFA